MRLRAGVVALVAALLLLLPLTSHSLSITIEVVGTGSQTYSDSDVGNPLGCSNVGSSVSCGGSEFVGGPIWTLDSWSVDADGDPFVNANLAITNNSGSTQSFVLTVLTTAFIAGPTTSGGSVSGSLTVDNNGGTLGNNLQLAMYTALIDGAPFQTLLPFDSSITALFGSANLTPDSFGLPGLTFPGPGVNANIGIRLEFTLTDGDQASLTSRFEVIPEPGTALLLGLGLAGLGLARRRRRS